MLTEQVLCRFRVFSIGKFVEYYRFFVKERLARNVFCTGRKCKMSWILSAFIFWPKQNHQNSVCLSLSLSTWQTKNSGKNLHTTSPSPNKKRYNTSKFASQLIPLNEEKHPSKISKLISWCPGVYHKYNSPSPSRLSAGKSLGIKPEPAARVLYSLSFFSAD